MAETKPDPTRRKQLKTLARMMNRQNAISIPVTPFLLDCFDVVITSEEAHFLLQMGRAPVTRAEAARIGGLPEERFRELFDRLLSKGLVRPKTEKGMPEQYVLSSALVGWFAFQLSRGGDSPEEKEFAHRMNRLFKTWGKMNIFPLRSIQNFIIRNFYKPFQSIAPAIPAGGKPVIDDPCPSKEQGPDLFPLADVTDLIETHGADGRIAVMHCSCRRWRELVNEPCRFNIPAETCIALGDMATQVDRYGFGREISMDEAFGIVNTAREAGAIHTVYYEKDDIKRTPLTICNCCWDCCGLLGSYNRGVFPLHLKCRHVSKLMDTTPCAGCLKCETFCPTGAVSISKKRPAIKKDRCIGCGQCAAQCPENRFVLEPMERNVFLPLLKKSEIRVF